MFFALCLLTAACADAEKPPKGAVTLIYMIGDGLGLAQVSMPVIGGGYVPKAFDRAQGAALIRTRRPTTACGFRCGVMDNTGQVRRIMAPLGPGG